MSQDDKIELGKTRTNRSGIFAALSGQAGVDVSGKGSSISAMVSAFVGRSARTGQPDTAATAAKLGVSQRTVQRWFKAEREGAQITPKADTLKKVQTLSRQAATTKAGRRDAMQQARRTGAQVSVSVTGRQGPQWGDYHYVRRRPQGSHVSLDPAEYEAMQDAYIDRGDAGLAQFLTDTWDMKYLDGWGFESIDDIIFEFSDRDLDEDGDLNDDQEYE